MPFHTRAREKCATDVFLTQVVHGVRKRPESSWPRIQPEVNKASLDGQKRTNPPVTAYDFWPKQPVKNLETAIGRRDRAARGHAVVGESLVKVVTHFTFQHHVREYFDGCSSHQSRQIRIRLSYPEIIAVSANLKMILC